MKQKTLKIIILSSMCLAFGACSPSSSDSKSSSDPATAASTDPLVDNTYFKASTDSSTNTNLIFAFKVKPGNTFSAITLKYSISSGAAVYRKYTGTYVKSGDNYAITYNYETCNPTGTDNLVITGNAASVVGVKQNGSPTTVMFYNDKAYTIAGVSELTLSSATEDVNCNLISKNAKSEVFKMASNEPSKSTRSIASEKKSVFEKLMK
jgi:hypothetical protein